MKEREKVGYVKGNKREMEKEAKGSKEREESERKIHEWFPPHLCSRLGGDEYSA